MAEGSGGRDVTHASSERRRLTRNAASAYGARALLGLSVLLLTPYLYRRLGAGGFGTLSVILTIGTTFSLIEMGFARGVSKITAELLAKGRRRELDENVGASVLLFGILGIAAAVVLLLVAIFGSGLASVGNRHAFAVGMAVLAVERLLYFPLAAYGAVLVGYQRYDLVNAAEASSSIAYAVGAIVAVALGGGVLAVAVIAAATHFTIGVAGLVFLRRVDPALSLRPRTSDRETRLRQLTFGSYVLLAESMTFIGQRMDTVVIAAIRSAATAAPYAAAIKLQTAVQSLTLPLVYQLMPMSSDLSARDRHDEVVRRLGLATRFAIQVTVPVAAGLALFAPEVMRLWLGPSAGPVAAKILVVLMLGQIVMMAAAPAEQVLVGVGRARTIGLLTAVEGVSNLGLSIVLISAYGAIGAALGTLFTSGVIGPLRVPLAARALQQPVWGFLVHTIGPAALSSLPPLIAMAAVRVSLPQGLLRLGIGVLVGGIAFLAVAYLQLRRGQLARILRGTPTAAQSRG
jgi:O-antigen/teichoic acid export membrane protein